MRLPAEIPGTTDDNALALALLDAAEDVFNAAARHLPADQRATLPRILQRGC